MLNLPHDVQTLIQAMHQAGYEIYVVGGSVRDVLMGRQTRGWDFTTNATPEQILSVFPDSFYDNEFGTVGVKIKNAQEEIVDIYEVTTFRSESGYTDFRHPEVVTWGKSVTEDLSRRDFTINAIAFDGKSYIDPYEGQKDIEKKIIRTVGIAHDRFTEDALRMMRAVRIATQLGFLIAEDTRVAIQAKKQLLSKISAERIRDELLKILSSDHPADGILLLKNLGLLPLIIPELEDAFTIGQKSPKRHHLYDVGTHSVMALRHCPSKDPIVRLATLLHDIGKPKTVRVTHDGVVTFYNHEVVGAHMAKTIGYRLKLSKKQIDKIFTLVRWHQFTVDETQTDSAIRRFIRRVTKEYLFDMLDLRIGDRLGGGALETSWRLELFKKRLEEVQQQPFTVADLKIDGHDVMTEYTIKPSKIVGDVLAALFAEVEEGTLPNEREALLAKLKKIKNNFVQPN